MSPCQKEMHRTHRIAELSSGRDRTNKIPWAGTDTAMSARLTSALLHIRTGLQKYDTVHANTRIHVSSAIRNASADERKHPGEKHRKGRKSLLFKDTSPNMIVYAI